jgi:hypothetical protein
MGQWYDLMVAVTRHDLPDFPTPSRQEHPQWYPVIPHHDQHHG